MSAQDLLGVWQLVSCYLESADGERLYPVGDAPVGLIMYHANGVMAYMAMRRGRTKFASGDMARGTPEELQEAFEGFDSYCGTYTVDEPRGSVIHHIEAARFPNWEGSDQVRYFRLEGDQLDITAPLLLRGVMWVARGAFRRRA